MSERECFICLPCPDVSLTLRITGARIARPCECVCYAVFFSSLSSWPSFKCADVGSSHHHLAFEKVFSSVVLNGDSCVNAWRTRLEPVSPQRFHGLQLNASDCRAGLDEHRIGDYGSGIRLMRRNIEVEIVAKCSINPFGVLAPFPPFLKEEYVVFEK